MGRRARLRVSRKPAVRQFLIDNARFYIDEYHVDGFRYDEVTVIDRFGGWQFCQDLTDTLRFVKPSIPQIAEYWRDDQSWVVKPTTRWRRGIRRRVERRAARGPAGRGWPGGPRTRRGRRPRSRSRDALGQPEWLGRRVAPVQHLENHDIVYAGHDDRAPRIAAARRRDERALVVRPQPSPRGASGCS